MVQFGANIAPWSEYCTVEDSRRYLGRETAQQRLVDLLTLRETMNRAQAWHRCSTTQQQQFLRDEQSTCTESIEQAPMSQLLSCVKSRSGSRQRLTHKQHLNAIALDINPRGILDGCTTDYLQALHRFLTQPKNTTQQVHGLICQRWLPHRRVSGEMHKCLDVEHVFSVDAAQDEAEQDVRLT